MTETKIKMILERLNHIQKTLVNSIVREVQYQIRKKINPTKICDWCLADFKYHTDKGGQLCENCYDDHKYAEAIREM